MLLGMKADVQVDELEVIEIASAGHGADFNRIFAFLKQRSVEASRESPEAAVGRRMVEAGIQKMAVDPDLVRALNSLCKQRQLGLAGRDLAGREVEGTQVRSALGFSLELAVDAAFVSVIPEVVDGGRVLDGDRARRLGLKGEVQPH
jgi:hypothetical protein